MLHIRSHHDESADEVVVVVRDDQEVLAITRLPATATYEDLAQEFQMGIWLRALFGRAGDD